MSLQDGKLSQKHVSPFGSIKESQATPKAHDDQAKPMSPCMLQRVGAASIKLLCHASFLSAGHTQLIVNTTYTLCLDVCDALKKTLHAQYLLCAARIQSLSLPAGWCECSECFAGSGTH